MVGLEITFQIAPDKRVEFLQTAESLMQSPSLGRATNEGPEAEGPVVFEQVGAKDCFLWREQWATRRKVDERLHSKPVNTLARVDFPQPDSPTMASVLPRAAETVTPLGACIRCFPCEKIRPPPVS